MVRGAGRQTIGAITNFISYWLLGLPLAALLAFRLHLGIHGLWIGLLVGCQAPFEVAHACCCLGRGSEHVFPCCASIPRT